MGYLKDKWIEQMQPKPHEWERRWIPVEERLPPDLELVLVNHEGTGIEMAARQPNGGWVICWTGFETNGVAYTHWMPLPEPPEVR